MQEKKSAKLSVTKLALKTVCILDSCNRYLIKNFHAFVSSIYKIKQKHFNCAKKRAIKNLYP